MRVGEASNAPKRGDLVIEDLLSGASGTIEGKKRLLAGAYDALLDLGLAFKTGSAGLDQAAGSHPAGRIQVLGVYNPEGDCLLPEAAVELERSHHRVDIKLGSLGRVRPELDRFTVADSLSGGKFENLNTLLDLVSIAEADWILIIDDDVALPSRFLDRFIFLIEKYNLMLAQPAQSRTSHAAWDICRRQPRTVLRETRFVEIGPVTAIHRDAVGAFMPFPPLKMGWGLDLHWSAVAEEHGWRMGVVDATPIEHSLRRPASDYSRAQATDEARDFLSNNVHIDREQATELVARHRSW